MPLADVICLANARKRSERCVACVHAQTGTWIRLVSREEHGELTYKQRNLGSAGEPRKLDVMRVQLASKRPSPGQPENWLVDGTPWHLLQRPARRATLEVLGKVVQAEDLLFGCATDRISASVFAVRPATASLALILPKEVRWLFEIIGSKQRVRAVFRLGQHRYNLSVTDPSVEEKVKSLPAGFHNCAEAGIAEDRLLFCISLGEVFSDGNCYKLVAGVIELP